MQKHNLRADSHVARTVLSVAQPLCEVTSVYFSLGDQDGRPSCDAEFAVSCLPIGLQSESFLSSARAEIRRLILNRWCLSTRHLYRRENEYPAVAVRVGGWIFSLAGVPSEIGEAAILALAVKVNACTFDDALRRAHEISNGRFGHFCESLSLDNHRP